MTTSAPQTAGMLILLDGKRPSLLRLLQAYTQAWTFALNCAAQCAGAHAGREVGGAAVGRERAPELAQPHLHVALAERVAAQHL